MLNQLQFMIIPSLFCPANCKYCFGPNRGSKMTICTMEKTLDYIRYIDKEINLENIKITFHGGEPLAAGYDFFESILNNIKTIFHNYNFFIFIFSILDTVNFQYFYLICHILTSNYLIPSVSSRKRSTSSLTCSREPLQNSISVTSISAS